MLQAFQIMIVSMIISVIVGFLISLLIKLLCMILAMSGKSQQTETLHGEEELAVALAVALARLPRPERKI